MYFSVPFPRAVALAALMIAGSLTALRSDVFAQEKKVAMSEEVSAIMNRMGETLRTAKNLSFEVDTIRAYEQRNGIPLHIFHELKVVVQRPDRLLIDVEGDDGDSKIAFDGKSAIFLSSTHKRFAKVAVPEPSIQSMLHELVGKFDIDMPLADFLSDRPQESLLSGVESGHMVNTVTIDGKPYDHLVFVQPPGIQLEFWISKQPPVLPKRLIVTYSQLPGSPRFIAKFDDWNLDAKTADTQFDLQPSADLKQIELKAPPAAQSR